MARRLIGRSWAAVVFVVVAGPAACTRDDRPAPLTPTSARPAPPARGGVVRVGVQAEPASLNPFDVRSRTLAANDVLSAVLPQLFVVRPDGSVHGSLVDDATVREAGTSVAFSLRRGAQWSDGKPITADDIRFTWEAIRSDQWHGPRDGYDTIAAVEGRDRDVTLRLAAPLPGWKRLFSGDDYVLPAHRLRGQVPLSDVWAAGPDLAGGPLKLAGVTPGLEVDLDRNDAFWGDKVAFGRVRMLVVPDGRTLEQLLAKGDLEVAVPVAGTNRVGRFKGVAGATVSEAPAGGLLTTVVANTDRLPLAKRRALFALVDRDRFHTVLLKGETAEPAPPSLQPGANDGPWRAVAADPADAKRLAGNGFTATLAAPDDEAMVGLLGKAMQTRGEETPITLELEFDDAAEVASTWRPTGRFDLMLSTELQWPRPCWRCRFAGDAVDRTNWSRTKEADDVAAAADRTQTAAAIGTLEAKLHDDALLVPLWRPRALVATRGVRAVAANSWAAGPLWAVTSWRPA